MRPVTKNEIPKNADGTPKTYSSYGLAKDDLIVNLGDYCSYCERQGYFTALDVEHIKPKNVYPAMELNWDNFLLGCKNCNSIKSNNDFEFNKIMFPHLNNTFLAIKYGEGGLVEINPALSQNQKAKIQKIIDLVGLDRVPGHRRYSDRDRRWQERYKAFMIAERYLEKYNNGEADKEIIKDLAVYVGFWSVWMTMFDEHKDVKQVLIEEFLGTTPECFDKNDEYKPVNRNGVEL